MKRKMNECIITKQYLILRNDNINTGFPDPYNQRYSVLTDCIHLDLHNLNKVVGWPGKRLNLSLKALDELGNPTGTVTSFSFRSQQQSDGVSSINCYGVESNNSQINESCLAN